MRALVLTIIRLGPCGAYIVAATSLLSVAQLCNAPASPLAWAVFTNILPLTRSLVLILVTASDLMFWGATLMLIVAAAIGGYLAVRPERYLQLRFMHAHVALLASGLAVVQISQSSAGLASTELAHFPEKGWSIVVGSSAGFALFVLTFLACLCAHGELIKRMRGFR